MTSKAGEADQTHSHPSETFYFVRGGRARIELPDGNSMESELSDGHVMWHEE